MLESARAACAARMALAQSVASTHTGAAATGAAATGAAATGAAAKGGAATEATEAAAAAGEAAMGEATMRAVGRCPGLGELPLGACGEMRGGAAAGCVRRCTGKGDGGCEAMH